MAKMRTKILRKFIPCVIAASLAVPALGTDRAFAGRAHDKETRKKELQEALEPVLALLKSPERREGSLAFNEGWRWVYWRKATTSLKDDLYKRDALDHEALKAELGLGPSGREEMIKEARGLAKGLREKGDALKARAIEALLDFLQTENDPAALEALVSAGNDERLKALALFFLGGYYEKMSFYPEASGYYSRLLRLRKEGYLNNAAHFRKSRMLFFEGKYEKAREGFRKSLEGGFRQSELLLAYTYLIRGEFASAGDFFEANRKGPEEMDSVSLSGLAEMDIEKKDYPGARKVLDILSSLYSKDPFLSAWFTIRKGDTFVMEGLRQEGEKTYVKVRDRSSENKAADKTGGNKPSDKPGEISEDKGEWTAMANLALADLYSAKGDADSLTMAERTFQSVAEGGYLGSEITLLKLIEVQTRLGKYEEALESVIKFPKRYPASAYKADLRLLNGKLVYNWIDHLSKKGDDFGVAEVSAEHGSAVPFGKKAETYLKAGKAYIEVGLESEAARALDAATKIGTDSILEEAMLMLGKVYYSQKDYASVERLFNAFAATFPKSPYMEDVEPLLLKAAHMTGNHEKAVALGCRDDLEAMYYKARSLAALKRNKEAIGLFEEAAAALSAKGEAAVAAKAWIGSGDINFSLSRFEAAVSSYGRALESLGDARGGDRSWALYRLGLSKLKIKKTEDVGGIVKELKSGEDDISKWADTLLKESM